MRFSVSPFSARLGGMLAASLLLSACSLDRAQHHAQGRYALDAPRVDSVTNYCRVHPEQCIRLAGEESLLPSSSPVHVLATAGAGIHTALRILDAATRPDVEEVLKHCAEVARTDVLLRLRGGRSPTPDECRQEVKVKGKVVKLAMYLGTEMHQAALQCVGSNLRLAPPKGVSLEPCYRYDPHTGKTTLILSETVEQLLACGCASELRGTFRPDVVIHEGNPLEPLGIYDFKFPCVNVDRPPRWSDYPPGHPCQDFDQKELYEESLGTVAFRVVPWLGIFP